MIESATVQILETDDAHTISCPICARAGCQPLWYDSSQNAYACKYCNVVSLYPSLPTEYYAGKYNEAYYASYMKQSDVRKRFYDRELARIEKKHSVGNLLDVGAGVGSFLTAAAGRGWEVMGIEPSNYASTYCRDELNLHCLCVGITELDPNDLNFSLITLWDVLAHVDDVMQTIENVRLLLDPNGLLVIKTPNRTKKTFERAQWLSKFIKQSFLRGILHLPQQQFHFSEESISKALELAGFSIVEVRKINEPIGMKAKLKSSETWKSMFKLLLVECLKRMLNNERSSLLVWARVYQDA